MAAAVPRPDTSQQADAVSATHLGSFAVPALVHCHVAAGRLQACMQRDVAGGHAPPLQCAVCRRDMSARQCADSACCRAAPYLKGMRPTSCHIDVGCLAAEHSAAQLPWGRRRPGHPANRQRSPSQTLLRRWLFFGLLLWLLLLRRQGRWPQVAAGAELLSHCSRCRGQQRCRTLAAACCCLFLLLVPVLLKCGERRRRQLPGCGCCHLHLQTASQAGQALAATNLTQACEATWPAASHPSGAAVDPAVAAQNSQPRLTPGLKM